MITRVTIVDDEQGTFAYERDEEDAFKWRLVEIGGHERGVDMAAFPDGIGGPHDGRDVLWQVASSIFQGVKDDVDA